MWWRKRSPVCDFGRPSQRNALPALVAAPAIEIDFEAIGWPAGWVLPWEKKAPPPRTPQPGFTGIRGPDIAQRIRAYIDKVDLAIEGESGSTPTFRLACTLVRDWACERDEA